jgi:competence protein ComEC
VLTHDDGDHTGGARAVLRSLRVERVLTGGPRPNVPGPTSHFRADTIAVGEVLHDAPPVRVLWPPHAGAPGAAVSYRGDNAAAVVLEVGEGVGRALLMADADTVVERQLAIAPGLAVLKAGHHGSNTSSGAAFVRGLAPRRVLVSVGQHNVYGHPSPFALARLAATGAAIDRTDREGAIWYEFSATGVRRLDWRRGEPFRAHQPATPDARAPALPEPRPAR